MAVKIRLTEKQQEIVNRMAAGWTLLISRDGWGGRIKGYACLVNPDNAGDWRYMSRCITRGLITKGVVAVEGSGPDYMTKRYKLTDVGLSLVKE